MKKSGTQHSNRPLNIPLDFDKVVEGLLAVDPTEPVETPRKKPEKPRPKGKKKPAKKK